MLGTTTVGVYCSARKHGFPDLVAQYEPRILAMAASADERVDPQVFRAAEWIRAERQARIDAERRALDADPTRPWGIRPRARAERIRKWRAILGRPIAA